eukprot:4551576-Ditylum_brightwellii.AAC.1
MSSPNSVIEGTDHISITSSSISNTRTSNVLPFGAGIPAASDRIAIASDTGNSNSAGHSSRLTISSSGHSRRLTRSSFHGQGSIGVMLQQQSSADDELSINDNVDNKGNENVDNCGDGDKVEDCSLVQGNNEDENKTGTSFQQMIDLEAGASTLTRTNAQDCEGMKVSTHY